MRPLGSSLLLLVCAVHSFAGCGPAPEPLAAASSELSLPAGALGGVATFSRGNGDGQQESFPVELAGGAIYLDWPALKNGNWKLSLSLTDAAGAVVFEASTRFLVGPAHPRPEALVLTDGNGASVTVHDRRRALLFWNTLDDPAAISSSRVGVPGEINGTVAFAPVHFGAGVGGFTDNMTYVAFDALFPATPLSTFAVEAWVQWGDLDRRNYSPFTVLGEPNAWGSTSFNIGVAQSPNGTGMIRDVAVVLQWQPDRYLVSIWRLQVPAASFVEHLAVSADLSASPGEKFRFYRDGVDLGPPNWAGIEVAPEPAFTFPTYVRIGQSVPATPWVLGCYVDNLKVWSYPKADYSDRSVE